MRLALFFLFVLFAPVGLAFAHGGGLDGLGCHHDRKAGGYHCHRGPLAGRSFVSKEQALAVLDGKSGQETAPAANYDRDDYLPRWADADGDCQDTRQEVLIAESVVAVTLDSRGCRVIAGRWHDPYTGRVFTEPGDLDIDHMVPLKEAHDSGAAAWPRARKRAYANDLDHPDALIVVEKGANRSKGSRDPAEWLPPNGAYHCAYVRAWTQVKEQWGLAVDRAEAAAIQDVLTGCPE